VFKETALEALRAEGFPVESFPGDRVHKRSVEILDERYMLYIDKQEVSDPLERARPQKRLRQA
jgi:hypothetical protein